MYVRSGGTRIIINQMKRCLLWQRFFHAEKELSDVLNKENLNPVQSKSEAREMGNPKERSGCPCHGGGVLEDFAGVFLLVKRLPVSCTYVR